MHGYGPQHWPVWRALLGCLLIPGSIPGPAAAAPLFEQSDLETGESTTFTWPDGSETTIQLLRVTETRCELRGSIRKADILVRIGQEEVTVPAANYQLPIAVSNVQIDCPVTGGYVSDSSKENAWALQKDARIRAWPKGSPFVPPGTFGCPVDQIWFANDTQMANEPCYVNQAEFPGQQKTYYHYGLDFGGAEGLTPVLAATEGTVVSIGGETTDESHPPTVSPRYDVIYIRDAQDWYYRYSHLHSFEPGLSLGEAVQMGQKLGLVGKEGGSGGWSHLHLDLSIPQPSGKYGITDAYPFAFQAFCERFTPQLVAVARPHQVLFAGDTLQLEGGRSWHREGLPAIREWTWTTHNGTTLQGRNPNLSYTVPGHFTETLKLVDHAGNTAWDHVVIQVFDRDHPDQRPPSIHAAYWPTYGIQPGDPVTFTVRTFGVNPEEGEETWDFGDGSPLQTTQSDGNANVHDPKGYATLQHRFQTPGTFHVQVSRVNHRGEPATAKLTIEVERE